MAEVSRVLGRPFTEALWDIETFYDGIEWPELAEAARATGFPLRVLAIVGQLHLGPRVLRIGQTAGLLVLAISRSTLAGCASSTASRVRSLVGLWKRQRMQQTPALPRARRERIGQASTSTT